MDFRRSCSFLIHLGGNCAFRAQRQQLFNLINSSRCAPANP